jgi:hypothetical protein
MHQTYGASGQQTAEGIQEQISLRLCDCGCKGEEMHERAVPVDAQLASEQRK